MMKAVETVLTWDSETLGSSLDSVTNMLCDLKQVILSGPQFPHLYNK